MTIEPLKLSWMGEQAILCDTGHAAIDLKLQERFWALAEQLKGRAFVREVVPGMNNLLVMIDAAAIGGAEALKDIETCWNGLDEHSVAGQEIEVPVRYGGQHGIDLVHVAKITGLSPEDYVRRHSEGRYIVFNLGSQPGFGYLGGLDPSLAVPRREVPRTRVEAGSIVIGGAQAGVISKTSPSGWHIIGKTDLRFFDPAAAPPALLAPGDVIRFRIESMEP
ncbi:MULTISPECIES: 5-oxoprolinase subunit PxpB [Agrobacterium]|uniref:5-oxoprolinase subunit PxpB n=1 Tax=Agrobacterium TaxID=357 RepID=UPI0011A19C67|nr:5-oxoprolinase subunit PxpB [Agrobacterium sp. DE0009]